MIKKKKQITKKQVSEAVLLVESIIEGIEETKGVRIVSINMKSIPNSASDYFVICEGTSSTHVKSIAGNVEEFVKKQTGYRPWHIEGVQNAEWILIDYVNVVVHIFQAETRSHYNLESMWGDAEINSLNPKIKKAIKSKKNVKPKVSSKKTTKTVSKKPVRNTKTKITKKVNTK